MPGPARWMTRRSRRVSAPASRPCSPCGERPEQAVLRDNRAGGSGGHQRLLHDRRDGLDRAGAGPGPSEVPGCTHRSPWHPGTVVATWCRVDVRVTWSPTTAAASGSGGRLWRSQERSAGGRVPRVRPAPPWGGVLRTPGVRTDNSQESIAHAIRVVFFTRQNMSSTQQIVFDARATTCYSEDDLSPVSVGPPDLSCRGPSPRSAGSLA